MQTGEQVEGEFRLLSCNAAWQCIASLLSGSCSHYNYNCSSLGMVSSFDPLACTLWICVNFKIVIVDQSEYNVMHTFVSFCRDPVECWCFWWCSGCFWHCSDYFDRYCASGGHTPHQIQEKVKKYHDKFMWGQGLSIPVYIFPPELVQKTNFLELGNGRLSEPFIDGLFSRVQKCGVGCLNN